MTQTLALFIDAYRQLNARKLFWVTLMLSGVVVAAFAAVGINDKGLKVLVWDVEFAPMSTKVMSAATFYKMMFVNFGINFWLAWLAAILALVSTASIIPDLVASGSIELVLSKPISRLRLFLTTYAAGLLFVALQVTIFSAISFLVLGIRGGTWEPALFLAVPVLVIFFSYLFSICALLGLLTRSTVTALLLTMLAWFLIFAVHGTESGLLTWRLVTQREVAADQARIDTLRLTLDRLSGSQEEDDKARADRLQTQLSTRTAELPGTKKTLERVIVAHRIFYGVKTLLPKTSETVSLLERWLIELAELPAMPQDQMPQLPDDESRAATMNDPEFVRELEQEVRSRSVGWVMGTSLVFEALVLGLAAFIFCRGDY